MLLCTAFLVLSVSASDSDRHQTAKELWRKGITSARNGAFDSASYYMKKTFAKGISDDSLYYLWAEIFLYKGVLDTALALNYSVPVSDESALNKQVYEQRYAIYTALGWEKEAKALLDSLGGKPPGWWRHFIPECTVYLSGGGYYENNAADKNYPYPQIEDSTETVINGNGIASVRVGWHLPVSKSQEIRFGGKLRYAGSRFSVANTTTHLDDSADASFGGYCEYSMFHDQIVAGYTINRKKDFLGIKTYLHQFFLRYAFLMDDWLGSVEAGYNYEAPLDEHFYYLMNYWDRMINKKNSLSFTLFLSGMKAKNLDITNLFQYLYVRDSHIYTDSTYSRPVISNLSFITWLPVDSVFDWLPVSQSIPQSFIGVNPHARYEYRMNKRFSIGGGCGYNCTWYQEKYSWVDFSYDNFHPANMTGLDGNNVYAAYNQNDSNYYWIEYIPLIGDIVLDSIPISFHRESRYRVDQSVALNLFFKSDFGKLGDLMLDINIRRNFSSLMKSAPVDIQRWYIELMLTWFFRFKPERGS